MRLGREARGGTLPAETGVGSDASGSEVVASQVRKDFVNHRGGRGAGGPARGPPRSSAKLLWGLGKFCTWRRQARLIQTRLDAAIFRTESAT